jgi:hypothetical protein
VVKKKQLTYSDLTPLLETNPEAFYWIGFIMADGWFDHKRNAVSLCMSSVDLEQLNKYAEFVGAKTYYDPPSKTKGLCFDSKTKEMYRVRAASSIIIPQLIERFELIPKKTYNPPNLSFIDNASDDLYLSFWAGLLDGDGSIISVPKHNSLTLRIQMHISWLHIIESFEDRLYNILDETRSSAKMTKGRLTKTKNETVLLSIGRYSVLEKLYVRLQTLDIPLMCRKWNKIIEYPMLKEELNSKK